MARKVKLKSKAKTASTAAAAIGEQAATDAKATSNARPKAASVRLKTGKRSSPRKTRASRKASGRRGKRYSDAERQKILATAKREGLTGAQVRDRFGISTLTYYTWRKKSGSGPRRGPGRPARSAPEGLVAMIREAIRERISAMLPGLVEREVGASLGDRRKRSR